MTPTSDEEGTDAPTVMLNTFAVAGRVGHSLVRLALLCSACNTPDSLGPVLNDDLPWLSVVSGGGNAMIAKPTRIARPTPMWVLW